MNISREDMTGLIELTYRTMGRAKPQQAIIDAVIEGCDGFDAAAKPHFEAVIRELDDIPKNLGKAFRAWYADWKRLSPDHLQDEKFFCRTCQGEQYFYCYDRDAKGMYRCTLSPCPDCMQRVFPGERLPSFQELKGRHEAVKPVGYKGGKPVFEREINSK